jgi:uncharacterized iron-regulated membrane protein
MTKGFLRFLRRNTIALLALFLALGGTTYAASTALGPRNSVASPQVVNGSLQTKDLSAKARKALKGNRGLRGLRGAIGPTGAAGAKGATGAQGPAPAKYLLSLQANGTITRQQGGVTVTHTPGTGAYTIVFPASANQCYPVANIYATTGHIVMNGFSGDGLNMFINTYNSANPPALTDEAFYLAVIC